MPDQEYVQAVRIHTVRRNSHTNSPQLALLFPNVKPHWETLTHVFISEPFPKVTSPGKNPWQHMYTLLNHIHKHPPTRHFTLGHSRQGHYPYTHAPPHPPPRHAPPLTASARLLQKRADLPRGLLPPARARHRRPRRHPPPRRWAFLPLFACRRRVRPRLLPRGLPSHHLHLGRPLRGRHRPRRRTQPPVCHRLD